MAGWFRMRQRLVRRLGAGLAAGGLLAATVAVPAQAADGAGAVHRPAPRLPKVAPATGVGVLHARKIRTRNAAAARYRPAAAAWPAAAQARIAFTTVTTPLTPAGERAARRSPVSTGAQAYGAGTSVWAQAVSARAGTAGIAGVGVRVLGHAAAMAAGVRGVVVTARAPAGGRRGAVGLRRRRFRGHVSGDHAEGVGDVGRGRFHRRLHLHLSAAGAAGRLQLGTAARPALRLRHSGRPDRVHPGPGLLGRGWLV